MQQCLIEMHLVRVYQQATRQCECKEDGHDLRIIQRLADGMQGNVQQNHKAACLGDPTA